MRRSYTARSVEGYRGAMIGLKVLGIRLLPPEDSPVLLLQEDGGTRCLPIWIGHAEAAAIAMALESEAAERPLTHDLLADVVRLVAEDGSVSVDAVREGVYEGTLTLGETSLSARPSDCVAVALRLGWPISCPRVLMDQVGVEVDPAPADEVEAFRAFLDSVHADDFTDE